MKYSGIYLVSNPTTNPDAAAAVVSALVEGIETCFPTAVRQTPWALQYRVFRDTIPPGYTPSTNAEGKPMQFAHTLQHLIHLSSLEQNRTYICTQPPAGTGTVSAIPRSQQDAYALLVKNQIAALWQPRHALDIQQGTTYAGGVFTVQIGELRLKREALQTGGTQSPGVVVCISTTVGSDDLIEAANEEMEDEAIDFDYAQAIIRDCWNQIKSGRDLGKSDAREVMMAPDYVQGFREKDAVVRMWCEVLRLRG